MNSNLSQYLPAIQKLTIERPLTKTDLLQDPYLIQKSGDLAMYYAPHNDYVNTKAMIVIVGITPGWIQMKTAYENVVRDLKYNLPLEEILKKAKHAASFVGSMRTNLINMLDQCQLSESLSLESTSSLFKENRHLLHTTSVIKYPVFYKNKNYTGHQPRIEQVKLLSDYAFEVFPNELKSIHQPALVIPLGKSVDHVISHLKANHKLPSKHTYLFGFPHPSGANGHRDKQFKQCQDSFKSLINIWSS